MFERLEEAGLRLRRDKCQLGYGAVEFLGHWVSQETNSEEAFEDRIFLTKHTHDLVERITQGQLDDQMIREAVKQIQERGRVVTGGFRK